MSEPAALRALVVKSTLELIDKLPPAQSKAVHARVREELKAELAAASSLSWINLSGTVEICTALVSVLSPKEFQDFYTRQATMFLDSPAAQSILKVTGKVIGLSPKNVIKINPISWGLVSRNCGTQAFRDLPSPTEADLVWTNVPKEVLAHSPAIDSFAAGMRVVFALTGSTGTVKPEVNAAARQIVMHYAWTLPSRAG
jgi:hypothetical protein